MMRDFEPSPDFVSKTMERICNYEGEMSGKRDRLNALLLSRRMRFALAVGAVLLGMLNLLRIASTLVAPALCF
jgi:hypothetical protein